MPVTARAVIPFLVLTLVPAAAGAQTGPSDPQVIAAASTAKINVSGKKLNGHVAATVRVGEDGKVREVLVTENTTEGLEAQLVKVLQSARFRPAIDASGNCRRMPFAIAVQSLPLGSATSTLIFMAAHRYLTY